MAAFIDLFDGPDGTGLTSRPGWVGISGSDDVLLLNGAGAVKDSGAGYEKSVAHDTGGQAHYLKAVVGAGFVADTDATLQLVVGTGIGAPRWGLGYRSSTGLLRLRTNGNGGDEDLAVGCAVGDELVMEWDYAAGSLVIKKNGATIATKSWVGSPFSGTYTGLHVAAGRVPRDDVFRSFETNVIGDGTAPILTSATGTATGYTTASGSVSTDEANGTLYYIATGNATESASTVKAGASQPVTATGLQSISLSSLSPGTTYRIHFLHEDVANNDSLVASSNEFTTDAPDVTGPTLTSPTATATGSSTATGSVNTNEANGTLYFYASTNATESVATVKASGASQAVTVTGVQGVSVTGLNGSTTYYLHFVHTDAADNDSTRVTSASFTTSVAPGTAKLTLPALRNNSGTLLANETGATVHIYEVANGDKVATVTGATTDSAGMLVVHSSSMTSGTQYRAVVVLASGAEGLQKVTATV